MTPGFSKELFSYFYYMMNCSRKFKLSSHFTYMAISKNTTAALNEALPFINTTQNNTCSPFVNKYH